jgi:glyoxylase-like metal-dependent hydrolase (beta-lactamase superfamily II)
MIEPIQFDERGAVPLHRRRGGSMDFIMASPDLPLFQINKFIYLSRGSTNSYLITTSEGDVIVSTGMAQEAPVHRAKFNQASTAPVKKIILTQAHLDIIGGTEIFREPGSEVIAHRNSLACQADDARIKEFRERRNPRFFGEMMEALSDADFKAMATGKGSVYKTIKADTYVDEIYRFKLGGVQFDVISLPGGETLDSLALWIPSEGIVFTGNALGPLFPHMPNLHTIRGDRPRPILPYLATYQRILDLNPEILVTGHFNPIRGRQFIAEELTRLRDAVQYVHDQTVEGMNNGRSLDSLKRETRLPAHLEVGEDYGTVSWAVEAIWHEYGGWFHYRSTTELYGVPYQDVHAEIAKIAGPDALASRAAVLVEENKPLEAIHLAEIALAADGSHEPALSAYIEAHRKLLAAAPPRNIWYQRWLRHEIATAERRRGANLKRTEHEEGQNQGP